MDVLIVLDAAIAWRDQILKREGFRRNKTDSLSHLSRLIAKGIIDIQQPLSEFLRSGFEDKIKLIDHEKEWSISIKKARKTILRSFYRFAKENKIKPAQIIIPFSELNKVETKTKLGEILSSSEDKAKARSLTDKNITCFFNEMFKLNPRDGLVTWMMWELKQTIHQILDLNAGSIDLENENLLPEMKRCIQEQSKSKSSEELLFTTKKGGRIHAGQLVRNMKAASLNAKLSTIISPKILYTRAIGNYEKKS